MAGNRETSFAPVGLTNYGGQLGPITRSRALPEVEA